MHYRDTALNLGASSYWRLGEASGTFADLVAGISGTASGSMTRGAQGPFDFDPDGSVDFDGATGFISMGDVYDFAGTASFTVSMWAYEDTLGNNLRLISKNNGATDGWRLHITSAGTANFLRLGGGTTNTAAGPVAAATAGAWHMHTIVYDGSNITAYTDAVAGTPVASSLSLPGNTNNFVIGSTSAGTSNWWDGRIDEVAVFSKALTAGEISNLYAARNWAAPSVEARVAWRPEQFNRVTNPSFETNTTGWSVSAGINAAGTSITRTTADAHSGSACASLVTPATANAGVNFDFGTQTFGAGGTQISYRFTVWLKNTAGSRELTLILGSEGTSSDRASRAVRLPYGVWTPVLVDWTPSAARTDVQLAVVNTQAVATTTLIDDSAVYIPFAHSQIENGDFISSGSGTSGWSVSASLNAAATSITRVTTDGFTGSTCAELVTTSTIFSGVNYKFGTATFTAGRTYRASVYLKSVSGTTSAAVTFGRSADANAAQITITTAWARYSVDWTPAADRTDVELAITNNTAAAMTVRIDTVEVYEAIDDISADAFGENGGTNLTYGRGTSFDGSGSATGYANVRVVNDDGKYAPDNSSSTLYGLISTGKRIHIRATYAQSIYGLFYGVIRRFVQNPMDYSVELVSEDMLSELAKLRYQGAHFTYTAASARVVGLAVFAIRNLSVEGPIEDLYVYPGSDPTSVLEWLDTLNRASGAIHYAEAREYSSYPWRLVVLDRTIHSDMNTASETWDDDASDVSGFDVTDEAFVNRQRVGVTAYQLERFNEVAQAYDPPSHSLLDDVDGKFYEASPNLVSIDLPPDQMPLTIPAGTRKTIRFGHGPMMFPSASYVQSAGTVTRTTEYGASFTDVTFAADASDNVLTGTVLSGTPMVRLPLNDEVASDDSSIWYDGDHSGDDISNPYINHPAHAYGLACWYVWRYNRARIRPSLNRENLFYSQLNRDIADRVYLTVSRMSVTTQPYVILNFRTEVSQNSRQWDTNYQVEELPGAPPAGWFTLGSSPLDGAAVLAY